MKYIIVHVILNWNTILEVPDDWDENIDTLMLEEAPIFDYTDGGLSFGYAHLYEVDEEGNEIKELGEWD